MADNPDGGFDLPESLRHAADMRTCGDPECYEPAHLKKPPYGREPRVLDLTGEEIYTFIEAIRDPDDMRQRIDRALSESVDRCARCKICDNQVDAVMRVLGYE